MSYRKIGGLHFIRVGRFHFIFAWSKKPMSTADKWFVISLAVWAVFVVAAYVLP